MRIDRYITKSRIIDLESRDLRGALKELLEAATSRVKNKLDNQRLLRELVAREKTMSTYLGNGVAVPHIRVRMNRRLILSVGRCVSGIDHESGEDYKDIRLIVLLLIGHRERSYLNILSSLARQFQDKEQVDFMIDSVDLRTFRDRILRGFSGASGMPKRRQSRFNQLFFREAATIANAAKCDALLVFGDTVNGPFPVPRAFAGMKVVLVTRTVGSHPQNETQNLSAIIELRSFSDQRLSQLRSAVLIGLTREIFSYNDLICCVGGIPRSNQMDTIVVVDVEREFHSVITREADLLPANVKVEVVERMIAVASTLAVQGREGKPVGCLFVIGDSEKVNSLVKPLVLNPFHGYDEVDRNVIDPFMDETIKEFSSIDGAFIIRGDGVIESAGSLIHAPADFYRGMPSGLGSRHSAAAAISMATECIAIVVSASSGQVTLFRRGAMIPLIDKSNAASL